MKKKRKGNQLERVGSLICLEQQNYGVVFFLWCF